MKVREVTKLIADDMILVVDATKVGYMSKPEVMLEADKNVIASRYGDKEVVCIEGYRKNKIMLCVK